MTLPRRVLAVALVAALLAVAGCSATDSGRETVGIGETTEIEQENRTIEVAVLEYRFEDSYETGAGETVTAPDGRQFLFVKVTARNAADEDGATPSVGVRPSNETDLALGDPPAWASDGWYRSVRPLPAGEERTGWVRRVVPGDATADDVRVAISPDVLITGDEFRWGLTD